MNLFILSFFVYLTLLQPMEKSLHFLWTSSILRPRLGTTSARDTVIKNQQKRFVIYIIFIIIDKWDFLVACGRAVENRGKKK